MRLSGAAGLRAAGLLALKATITIALIAFAARQADFATLDAAAGALSGDWLLLLIAATALQVVVMCGRWSVVLRMFELGGRIFDDARIFLIGLCINQAVPTFVGGDVGRAIMLRRRGGSFGDSINAVVLDRAVALAAVLVLIAPLLPFLHMAFVRHGGEAFLPVVWLLAVAALGAGFTILAVLFFPRVKPPVALPAWLERLLSLPALVIGPMRRHPRMFLAATLTSVFGHGLTIVMAWLIAKSFGFAVGFFDLALIVPPVVILAVAPISLAGWGVREAGLVTLLGVLGVPAAEALVVSVGLGVAQFAQGAAGGLLWLLKGREAGDLRPPALDGLGERLRRVLWSRPGRRRWTMATLAVFASVVIAVLWIDQPLALYVHEHLPDWVRGAFKRISGLGRGEPYWIGGGVAIVASIVLSRFAVSVERHEFFRRLAISATFFIGALATTGLALLALKQIFGRLRPKFLWEADMLQGFYSFNADHGALAFPSGHTQTAFAVATALYLISGRFKWPLFALAALAGISRVVLAQHFLGDVIFGAFLGFAGTYALHQWLLSRSIDPTLPGLPVPPVGGRRRDRQAAAQSL